MSKTNKFPDQEDLSGAATALLRLQDTYALTTDKVAHGDLQGIQNSALMTGEWYNWYHMPMFKKKMLLQQIL